MTMNETLNRTFMLGDPAPRAQVARRTATGMVAYTIPSVSARGISLEQTYLEHLNECHTQVQIRHIAAYQTQTEEQADRDDGSQENPSGHFHRLSAIEQCSRPRKDLGHERRKGKMPCREDDC